MVFMREQTYTWAEYGCQLPKREGGLSFGVEMTAKIATQLAAPRLALTHELPVALRLGGSIQSRAQALRKRFNLRQCHDLNRLLGQQPRHELVPRIGKLRRPLQIPSPRSAAESLRR